LSENQWLSNTKTITGFAINPLSPQGQKKGSYKRFFTLTLLGLLFSLPFVAHAGMFSFIADLFGSNANAALEFENKPESIRSMRVLSTTLTVDPDAKDAPNVSIVDDVALMPDAGVVGTIVDVEDIKSTAISVYTVHKGDSLGDIAKMFKVSVNTISWANDLVGGKIREGDVLVILPVTGISHTVKKGDTISSIAKKYKADIDDIMRFNDVSLTSKIALGSIIVVPDGEMPMSVTTPTKPSASGNPFRGGSGPSYEGYYARPIIGGTRTQGLHGYNGIDFAGMPIGSPILASASGAVIIARDTGWNGGYGKYVVISHPNGTQTLYGHLSAVGVNTGDIVKQGDLIGALGNTGKSTGPHLHFEVRGAWNPFQ